MGTRSLTTIKQDGKLLVNIYRQYDGYISCHGRELANILTSRKMVNGIVGDYTGVFNGPGCMAAQLIRQLKTEEAGNIYIALSDEVGSFIDYTYIINVPTTDAPYGYGYGEMEITVESYSGKIFEGSLPEFKKFVYKEYDEE